MGRRTEDLALINRSWSPQALFDSEYSPKKGIYAGGFGNHG